MGSRLRTRRAVPAYCILFLFVIFGLLALPTPSRTSGAQPMGSSVFEEAIGEHGQSVTIPVSVSVSFGPLVGEVKTMTPLLTIIAVNFGLTSKNLSSLVRILSASVMINNSVLQGASQSGNMASIPLSLSLDKEFNWDGSATPTVTYLQTGSLTGILEFSGVLNNGTEITRHTSFLVTGFTIYPSNYILDTLEFWGLSSVLWAAGVVIFAFWVSRIEPTGKSGRRHS